MIFFSGLTLEINIEQDEYVSSLGQEAGVRVFVGVPNDMPFPFEQGTSVSPGFATGIELRKVMSPICICLNLTKLLAQAKAWCPTLSVWCAENIRGDCF